MSKLTIIKDDTAYWLSIKSENGRYSAIINLATVGKFPESITVKAIEEALEDQRNHAGMAEAR